MKSSKSKLAARRAKLNKQKGIVVPPSTRIDSSHEGNRYDHARKRLIEGQLSPQRLLQLLDEAMLKEDRPAIRLCCQGLIDAGKADADTYAISGLTALRLMLIDLSHSHLSKAAASADQGPNVQQARKTLVDVRKGLAKQPIPIEVSNLHDDATLQSARVANDRIMEYMALMAIEPAHAFAVRSANRFPDFVPILNNVVHLSILLGKFDTAERAAVETCERFPNDTFAKANLANARWWQGDVEGCLTLLKTLTGIPENRREALSLAMEVAYRAGDAMEMIRLFEEHEAIQDKALPDALERDFAMMAWAYDQVGMRGAVKAIIERLPSQHQNEDFWDDIRRAPDDREGHTPLHARTWLPQALIEQLKLHRDDGQGVAQLWAYAERHPVYAAALLDRGPQLVRQMLLAGCEKHLQRPTIAALITEFAGSRNAPLASRLKAKVAIDDWTLRQENTSGSSPVAQFCVGGIVIESRLTQQCWSSKQATQAERDDAVQALADQGFQALNHGNSRRAEAIFREAISLETELGNEPGPDLYQNLSAALEGNGKLEEANEVVAELRRRQPDYFFGQMAWLKMQICEGKANQTEAEWRELLAKKSSLQLTELSAASLVFGELKRANQDAPAASRYRSLTLAANELHRQKLNL